MPRTKHKEKGFQIGSLFLLVGVPGLEPGKAGPESAVLPLHHTPIWLRFPKRGCKGTAFFGTTKVFPKKKQINLLF